MYSFRRGKDKVSRENLIISVMQGVVGVKTRLPPNIDRWKNTIRLLATFGEFANVLLMADLGIIFKAYI